MHQQLWGYKVEEKLYVGVREQKRLNTAGLEDCSMNLAILLHACLARIQLQLIPWVDLFTVYFVTQAIALTVVWNCTMAGE
jgi:hypothetical protein